MQKWYYLSPTRRNKYEAKHHVAFLSSGELDETAASVVYTVHSPECVTAPPPSFVAIAAKIKRRRAFGKLTAVQTQIEKYILNVLPTVYLLSLSSHGSPIHTVGDRPFVYLGQRSKWLESKVCQFILGASVADATTSIHASIRMDYIVPTVWMHSTSAKRLIASVEQIFFVSTVGLFFAQESPA